MYTPFRTKQKLSIKKTLLASFLAVSLPAASLAHAEHDGDKELRCERGDKLHYDMHEGKARYLRELNLTSAQKDQLFSLNYAQIPVMRDLHKQHQQLIKELRETAQAEKFDDAKIQQLSDKVAKLEKEKALVWARHDAQVFALLTSEQRKQAREFKIKEHDLTYRDERGNNDDKYATRFNQKNNPLKSHNI